MYAELYKSKAIYHNNKEIGAIYYGDNLLWKKPVIRKYSFSHLMDSKFNYYHMNKVRLYKDYDNIEFDRIKLEYQNYNMFNIIQVVDSKLELMPTNITFKNNVFEGGATQIDKENGNIFFISDKDVVVHDKFGNHLGKVTIPLKGEISNILVDFDGRMLYVFLDKTYGELSISKYSFKIDNHYSDILDKDVK